MKSAGTKLKIVPCYTGFSSLEKAILTPEGKKVLFLEILFNETIRWETYLNQPEIKRAYAQALGWYGHYKTAITGRGLRRKPLSPLVRKTKPASENERLFWEALHFAEVRHKRSRKTS